MIFYAVQYILLFLNKILIPHMTSILTGFFVPFSSSKATKNERKRKKKNQFLNKIFRKKQTFKS